MSTESPPPTVERIHGLLWFDRGVQARSWNITDPDAPELWDACRRLRPALGSVHADDTRTSAEKTRDDDLFRVLRCVEDYHHLTAYELGVTHIIRKLRVIWRARRSA